MIASNIELGMRVRIITNGMIALVVGQPEYYRPRASLVRIKYENSTRYEYMIDNNLELLPTEEQYPAYGGTHTREGSF